MTDVTVDSLFPSLEAKAARLNEASDSANKVLVDIEQRLLKMNIGIEVFASEPLTAEAAEGYMGPQTTTSEIYRFLGWARAEGRWCLAVKVVRVVKGFFEGDTSCPYTNPYPDAPAPLLQASRDLRIAALQKMPDFLRQLDEKIVATTREIVETANRLKSGQR